MRFLQKFLPTHFVREFLAMEAAGGIVMIVAAALALILANSPLSAHYQQLIITPVTTAMDLSLFTQDVLMALFFFTVGLELKYEMREGTLAARGQKILPLIAAIGGILAPAIVYLAITHNHPEYRQGWAIPTATDIAFALCVLRLVGSHIPQAAKIFLLAIAIYDDLAAIIIIASVYSNGVALVPLAEVAAITAALFALNRLHVSRITPYLLLGVALWFAVHHAGIHPTIAGVITALAIPMQSRTKKPLLAPLLHYLHPYVAFAVLPLFAFTSAGVDVRGIALADMTSALPVGIALALFLGKPLGIFTATFACVKLRIAALPEGINWSTVFGLATIAGIGFTMSLFIGALAFPASMLDAVKIGVLAGSLLSALGGVGIFLIQARNHRAPNI